MGKGTNIDEKIKFILENPVTKEIIKRKFGEVGYKVLEILFQNEKIIDLQIANILKLEPNTVRIALYRFRDNKFADYIAKRKENIAWIDFIWYLKKKEFVEYIKNEIKKLLEEEKKKLEYIQEQELFFCPNCGRLFEYGKAMEFEFTCPRCNQELVYLENKESLIEEIKNKIKSYEEVLKKLES